MKIAALIVAFALVAEASEEFRWRPPPKKGPPRPKGPPTPPENPSGPSGPLGPFGPLGPSGPVGPSDSCGTGEADASKCTGYVPPDTSTLGPFGPSVAASEPTGGVSAGSICGDDARPYYEEHIDGDFRYVITSGCPNHAAECGQIHVNPNLRCERWQWSKLPLTWSNSGSMHKMMGTTGFVKSGGVVFDHRSSPLGDLAACHEWQSLDPSHGHSDPSKQYHYHAVPSMYSNADDPEACEHIGYMRDGAKLFGLCGLESCYKLKEGVTEAQMETDYEYIEDGECQLDECNMAEKDGEMAYFISANWPYVPPCLKGQVASIQGLTVD